MRRGIILAGVLCLVAVGTGYAQEHYTEGPVWGVSHYRTTPGHFEDYMTYLRQNFLPSSEEGKKQGLILDFKVFVKEPKGAGDWDVAVATLYASYGKALDYSKADEDKWKAIAATQYKTEDEKKQEEMTDVRWTLREYLGTTYMREINLKPMP
jgi:hypothetical protein